MASVAKRTWTYKGEAKSAWVVRYTDQSGKRRLQTFTLKKDADKYRTHIETEIERGVHTPASVSPTISQAADLWLKDCEERCETGDNMSPYTLRYFQSCTKNHIKPFLGTTRLSALTGPMLKHWVNDLARHEDNPRRYRTIESSVNVLCLLIGFTIQEGLIGHNILREARPRIPGVKNGRIKKPTRDEIKLMLAKSSGLTRLIVHMAILTGLRRGELCGLTWDCVDFDSNIIHVRQQMDHWGNVRPPKTKAGIRDVPFGPALALMLKEKKIAHPIDTPNFVLISKHNRVPMRPQNLYINYWKPFVEEIGLIDETGKPKYHFHALRHSTAMFFIEQQLPPKRIQKIMGHSSIKVTFDVYGDLFDDSQDTHEAASNIEAGLLK